MSPKGRRLGPAMRYGTLPRTKARFSITNCARCAKLRRSSHLGHLAEMCSTPASCLIGPDRRTSQAAVEASPRALQA